MLDVTNEFLWCGLGANENELRRRGRWLRRTSPRAPEATEGTRVSVNEIRSGAEPPATCFIGWDGSKGLGRGGPGGEFVDPYEAKLAAARADAKENASPGPAFASPTRSRRLLGRPTKPMARRGRRAPRRERSRCRSSARRPPSRRGAARARGAVLVRRRRRQQRGAFRGVRGGARDKPAARDVLESRVGPWTRARGSTWSGRRATSPTAGSWRFSGWSAGRRVDAAVEEAGCEESRVVQ